MSEKASVLIVDDEKIVQEVFAQGLQALGFSCATAEDGAAGLEALKRGDYDVALIDLQMPKMNGFELLKAMGRDHIGAVPIILSGHGEVANVVEVMKLGAFDFIEKPSPIAKVAVVLERAAIHRRAVRFGQRMADLAGEWEATFDASPDPIVVLDPEWRILRCNRATEKRTGAAREHLIGRPCHEVLCGEDHNPQTCPFHQEPPDGSTTGFEVHHKLWGGYFDFKSAAIKDRAGAVAGTVHIAHDITQRTQLEARLRQEQKLRSIGQLAAGIAHEINTPTQFIGDNTRFLQQSFADIVMLEKKNQELLAAAKKGPVGQPLIQEVEAAARKADMKFLKEEIPKAIERSLAGIDRIAKIVRAMTEFSYPDRQEKTPLDLNKAIESTITISRNEWKYVADVVTDFDPSLPPVACFPGPFNQVILNLVTNAAQAIGDKIGKGLEQKGQICVSTRADGRWAEIKVADTGTGIPESIRDRVFDPFFTTKEIGRGTGQGLSICHAVIVQQHGGTIAFETETGRGTTFTVRLPLGEGRT